VLCCVVLFVSCCVVLFVLLNAVEWWYLPLLIVVYRVWMCDADNSLVYIDAAGMGVVLLCCCVVLCCVVLG
jgi:hypothetical protein